MRLLHQHLLKHPVSNGYRRHKARGCASFVGKATRGFFNDANLEADALNALRRENAESANWIKHAEPPRKRFIRNFLSDQPA